MNNPGGLLEDIRDLVAARSIGDTSIISEKEREVRIKYLNYLRYEFQSDRVREIFEDNPDDPLPSLMDHFIGAAFPGSEGIFESVVSGLVEETRKIKESGHTHFLVDKSTGKLLLPIGPDTIYTPPDFLDEGGNRRKSSPIIHPGISAPLALRKHEESKIKKLLVKHGESNAFEHVRDEYSIVRHAEFELESMGFKKDPDCEAINAEDAMVGKEFYDGTYQSPNLAFHRSKMFGKILARRVSDSMNKKGTRNYSIISISLEVNSKLRWYQVKYLHA